MSESNMTVEEIQRLRERIKQHEGCELTPYKDTKGNMTVGYGHKIVPSDGTLFNPDRRPGTGTIHPAEADELFDRDFDTACRLTPKVFPYAWDKINGPRQGVLVEMIYQLGAGAARDFLHMRAALNLLKYRRAAAEMVDSDLLAFVESHTGCLLYTSPSPRD